MVGVDRIGQRSAFIVIHVVKLPTSRLGTTSRALAENHRSIQCPAERSEAASFSCTMRFKTKGATVEGAFNRPFAVSKEEYPFLDRWLKFRDDIGKKITARLAAIIIRKA